MELSHKAKRALEAAMGRENCQVACDLVTADELIAAGLAERTPAGDVFLVD